MNCFATRSRPRGAVGKIIWDTWVVYGGHATFFCSRPRRETTSLTSVREPLLLFSFRTGHIVVSCRQIGHVYRKQGGRGSRNRPLRANINKRQWSETPFARGKAHFFLKRSPTPL